MLIYDAEHLNRLLLSVAGLDRPGHFSALIPQRGREYTGELMVVGRCTNGRGSPDQEAREGTWFTLVTLADPTTRSALIARILAEATQEAAPARDPLSWVVGLRSQFWGVARRIACGLGLSESRWYRHVAWSNLYKVAPAAGGTVTETHTAPQMEVCQALLRHELVTLRPRRDTFMLGCGSEANWFQWFEGPLGLVEQGHERLLGRHPIRWGAIGDASVIVLPHPQGKPLDVLAEAAVGRFGIALKQAPGVPE